jgi:Dyp-type peroxidase family
MVTNTGSAVVYGTRHKNRRQVGVVSPSAAQQGHILVVRLNLILKGDIRKELTRRGVEKLCTVFERISNGDITIDIIDPDRKEIASKLEDFNFSATIGFGIGFFDKLGIASNYRPRRLYKMPNNLFLHDAVPYSLSQTDLILQLCSTQEYVNKWVLSNEGYSVTKDEALRRPLSYVRDKADQAEGCDKWHDVVGSIRGWAKITDIHSGFQRLDGRNLMGFRDGISQPSGQLRNKLVWTTRDDESPGNTDGTYMVFQRIEHDLELWQSLTVDEQERWIGRSKATGLLLGTLSREDDLKLAQDCKSSNLFIRKRAQANLQKLLDVQRNPERRFFTDNDFLSRRVQKACPVGSHVRRTNPRGAEGSPHALIYRRGYLFMEDSVQSRGIPRSGLLFICFQKDIRRGFEYIKRNFSKNSQKSPGVPSHQETNILAKDKKKYLGPVSSHRTIGLPKNSLSSFDQKLKNSSYNFDTSTLGGGYYFVPPIPNSKISEIGQQYFER